MRSARTCVTYGGEELHACDRSQLKTSIVCCKDAELGASLKASSQAHEQRSSGYGSAEQGVQQRRRAQPRPEGHGDWQRPHGFRNCAGLFIVTCIIWVVVKFICLI